MRREIQNPQMFETDPESFYPAIYFSGKMSKEHLNKTEKNSNHSPRTFETVKRVPIVIRYATIKRVVLKYQSIATRRLNTALRVVFPIRYIPIPEYRYSGLQVPIPIPAKISRY
jgi:hypothetical protein